MRAMCVLRWVGKSVPSQMGTEIEDRRDRVELPTGDDVIVDAGQRENLRDYDGGDDADSPAQDPGQEVGTDQIHCRRVIARGDRQRDSDALQA